MLEIKQVNKFYKQYQACCDITMHFAEDKIVGLFGANGAGKSTCFHIMTGLITPDSGKILLGNTDITSYPIYKRAEIGLSFLPQDRSIFLGLTVEQNIMSVLELSKKSNDEKRNRLETLIDEFSLSKVRHTLGSLLSGGERRRTEIARTMANNPRFILLDEPFSGVDPISIQEIKNLLHTIQKKDKVGILISDHNVGATLPICDYAYIMHLGKILAEGTPHEISKNDKAQKYYLGDSLKTLS